MKSYAYDLLINDKRIDGRKLDEYRTIEIKQDRIKHADGSAVVTIGKTKVMVGIKMEVGTPFSDTPDEGTLMVNSEFAPIASPDFETGPPNEDSVELARVVDRGLRESHCVDFKKLCITSGEKVWTVFVDIHIINDDGNLIDCSFLASLAALMNTKLPSLDDENKVIRGESEENLEVNHQPIEVTVSKLEDNFILDPDADEEKTINCKLTVAVREDDMICALQKQGNLELSIEDTKKIIEIAIEKSKELRKFL